MTAESIRTALAEIAREELGWRGPLPDADLASALDSVKLLTLVIAVEDRFRICLEPKDEERIRSVADLVGVIRSKLDG